MPDNPINRQYPYYSLSYSKGALRNNNIGISRDNIIEDMALTKDQQLLSKIATNDRHGENSPYFDGWKAYDNNPYHPINNREGVIQMGLAENQV